MTSHGLRTKSSGSISPLPLREGAGVCEQQASLTPAGEGATHADMLVDPRNILPVSGGFTLAEVLITLGIIGVVAVMTLPAIINKAEQYILTNQFKKTYSTIQNAINLVSDEYGMSYECYNTGFGNYHEEDCQIFWKEFVSKLKVIKTCATGDNNCRPFYKSKSKVLLEGGEVKNTACTMNLPGMVYYLQDGAMINSQGSNVFFVIDINGFNGPNKWGYDLFYVNLNKDNVKGKVYPIDSICAMKEKGGNYFSEMILK